MHSDELYMCVEIETFPSGENFQPDFKVMILKAVTINLVQHAVLRNLSMDKLVLGMTTKCPVSGTDILCIRRH